MAMKTRYSFGGDEHVFVEIDEEMSLDAFFKSLSMTNAVRDSRIKGVTEICPANASLQIRFDPDVISPDDMLAELKRLESAADKADPTLKTRIIEIPVYYNDPWTHETLMRFRGRHQEPTATDLEYAAKINNYGSVDDPREGAFEHTLVRLDGRVRRRAALHVPDGGAVEADRSAQISAPAYGHAETDGWPWRLLRLHLLGARRRRLPDVWHHAHADLRSEARSVLSPRFYDLL
jgi:hypothetical protein